MPSLMRSLPEKLLDSLGGSLQHGYQTLVAADGELAIESIAENLAWGLA